MPFYAPGLNASVNGVTAAGNRVSFHTADPGSTGASEIAGTGRPASTFPAASAGSSTGSQVSAPIPAGTTVTHWGLWSAATGGNFLYSDVLRKTTDQTPTTEVFGNAGTIQSVPTISATN